MLATLLLALVQVPAGEPVPPVTNQWYSGLFFARPGESFALFPHPLAVKFEKDGLGVGYPEVKGTEKSVAAGYAPDVVIGTGSERPVVTAAGPAHVVVARGDLRITIARGVPAVWVECVRPATLRVRRGKRGRVGPYLILADGKPLEPDREVRLAAGKGVVVALKPDGGRLDPADIPPPPRRTAFTWSVADGTVRATIEYSWASKHAGLVAWLPHQWADREVGSIGTYRSVRGTMKLVRGGRIDMRLEVPSILAFPEMVKTLTPDERGELASRIDADAPGLLRDSVNRPVYDLGKRLFKLAQVAEIAAAAGHPRAAALADKLQEDLHAVLGKEPGEKGAAFEAVDRPRGIVAVRDQYGNREFNDHHFHYGYYLAAAGTLLTLRPQTAGLVEPSLLALIGDVGNPEQGQALPFCRGFDVYAGHSWASGFCRFHDGNNQESTSEALMRWYGLFRLGRAIHDRKTADLALTGLAIERRAVRFYWLGQRPDVCPFPAGYGKPMASMIWGGKSDFATWFSGKPTHVYGIQFLPMSPVMTHVRAPETFARYADYGADGGWDDIYYMVAAANGRKVPAKLDRYEAGNSSTFYYLWTRTWARQR